MVEGFGGVMTQLTKGQAEYINVPQDGPFKPRLISTSPGFH